MISPGELWVRWMVRADLEQCVAIDATHPPAWDAGVFEDVLRLRMSMALVAERGERVQGYIVYLIDRGRYEIVKLTVAPAARRQGVGRALLAELQAKLTARRPRLEILLRERNLGGQLFLKALGFRAVESIRGLYCGDEDIDPQDAIAFDYELPAAVTAGPPRSRLERWPG